MLTPRYPPSKEAIFIPYRGGSGDGENGEHTARPVINVYFAALLGWGRALRPSLSSISSAALRIESLSSQFKYVNIVLTRVASGSGSWAFDVGHYPRLNRFLSPPYRQSR